MDEELPGSSSNLTRGTDRHALLRSKQTKTPDVFFVRQTDVGWNTAEADRSINLARRLADLHVKHGSCRGGA